MPTETARCDECRSDVAVPADYAHGDKVRCGTCGAQLRVLRSNQGGPTRLVMADSGPMRAVLEQNRLQTAKLQSDLKAARASWGIGVNGLGLGVLYVVARIGLEGRPLDTALVVHAVVIAVVVGVLLEVANSLFLAKRGAINRLTGEIEEARKQARQLQARIREAERPIASTRSAPR